MRAPLRAGAVLSSLFDLGPHNTLSEPQIHPLPNGSPKTHPAFSTLQLGGPGEDSWALLV